LCAQWCCTSSLSLFQQSPQTVSPDHDLATFDDELQASFILEHLQRRFLEGQTSTFVGPMLITVNPHANLIIDNSPHPEHLHNHMNKTEGLPPHPCSIAQRAFERMVAFEESQSIIVMGESGSGKTQTTKKILQFLTSSAVSCKPLGKDLSQMIMAADFILEAFGNAMTAHNPNSSRFGKFFKVLYDKNNHICGARIQMDMLLDKSRVVFQAPGERNFHIFYMLIKGCTEEERKDYHLHPSPAQYAYCTHGDLEDPEIDDKKWMDELRKAFDIVGFSSTEIRNLNHFQNSLRTPPPW